MKKVSKAANKKSKRSREGRNKERGKKRKV